MAPITLDDSQLPQLQETPVADANDAFQKDWKKAKKFYDAAIASGDRTPAEADAIYYAPVREKWQVAATTPKLLTDPTSFQKFNNDFDRSKDSFDGLVRDGQDPLKAAAATINPNLQKWQLNPSTQPQKRKTEAEIESENSAKPDLVKSEKDLNASLDAAKDDPFAVVAAYYAHPEMLNVQPFERRNDTLYREARAKILSGYDTKGKKPQSVVELANQKKVWQGMLTDPDLPPEKLPLVQDAIKKINQQMFNPLEPEQSNTPSFFGQLTQAMKLNPSPVTQGPPPIKIISIKPAQ